MSKSEDELNELLHWLAYTFPGVYKIWTDKRNNIDFLNHTLKRRD